MRFLILEPGFPPELAPGHLTLEFAKELVKRGHIVTVVTMFPRKYLLPNYISVPKRRFFYLESLHGIKVIRVWPQFISKSPISRALEYIASPLSIFIGGMLAGKSDIIQYPSDPLFLPILGSILAHLHGSLKLLRVQDIHPDALIKIGLIRNKLLIKVLEILERLGYHCSDHITVIAKGYRRNILSKGVPSEKVSVMPNWADIEEVRSSLKTDELTINGLAEKFIATYAGTMSWPQDLETLIEAARLLKDYEDILFLLVGEGVKKELLMKKSKEFNLKNVIFMPLQPRSIYFKILQASDACFVPLRKSYNSPTAPSKMLEIMAYGKPIIANVPYNSDVHSIISEAESGVWVEPENPEVLSQAVLNLYKNRSIAKQLGEKGREFVRTNLSLTTCMNKYEILINSLFAKRI